MFSKELKELDKNTVQLMIDEMQGTIQDQQQKIDQKDQLIQQLRDQLAKAKK